MGFNSGFKGLIRSEHISNKICKKKKMEDTYFVSWIVPPPLQYVLLVIELIKLLKPTGYAMHQKFEHTTTVRSAHTVFMCFVFIWE